jgi:sugar/nucleoside kinase (ribokinase family)
VGWGAFGAGLAALGLAGLARIDGDPSNDASAPSVAALALATMASGLVLTLLGDRPPPGTPSALPAGGPR